MGSHRHRLATPTARLVALAANLVVLVAGLGAAITVAHAASPRAAVGHPIPKGAAVIDGFTLTHLPDGLGGRTSEHTYTWNEVGFRNLVWESRLADGAYRVDLNAHVLRGAQLSDPAALREFLTKYLERDPEAWQLDEVQLGNRVVLAADRDVFWLVRPGVAVWLSCRPGHMDRTDLLAVAEGVRETGQRSPNGSS